MNGIFVRGFVYRQGMGLVFEAVGAMLNSVREGKKNGRITHLQVFLLPYLVSCDTFYNGLIIHHQFLNTSTKGRHYFAGESGCRKMVVREIRIFLVVKLTGHLLVLPLLLYG